MDENEDIERQACSVATNSDTKYPHRAIALSLQEAAKPPPIVLDNDHEDDEDARFQAELQRALEASKAETSQKNRVDGPPISEPQSNGSSASAFISERAQLEKERRERQKRLRREAGLDDNDEGQMDGDGEPRAKRQHLSSLSGVRTNSRPNPVPSSSSSSSYSATVSRSAPSIQNIEQLFWDGELRPIANKHADPREDGKPTFRLTEILGKVSVFPPFDMLIIDFSYAEI